MRITLHSDYALRMLIYLALRPDRAVTVGEIAASYRISRHHLLKVALHLSQAGFVETTRGRSGGLRLARPAAEISIGSVVRHLEEDFALVECLKAGGGACAISPSCRMKAIFREALVAFLAVLDRHTLGNVVHSPEDLFSLLGMDGAVPRRLPGAAMQSTVQDGVEA